MAMVTTGGGVDARARPRVREWVDRRRLRETLDASDPRLILVSAPAGFGKTTLVAGWGRSAGIRLAWVALDARANELGRFTAALLAATDPSTDPAGVDRSGAPGLESNLSPELALSAVVERLAAATRDGGACRACLVLDDYHAVEARAVHKLVADLIERLPPRASVVIATRADPPIPMARLRAAGELLELRADDLRFAHAEADELLRSAGVELGPGDVDLLVDRSEGWAAVLRLAAVSLRDRVDAPVAARRFGATHRFVLDYVVEEVLAGVSPQTEAFLLRTSILERLCGGVCDAVTDDADGQERLEELERANLLIVPLDDERRWYRYHALLAEILRARLMSEMGDGVRDLHRRAARWFAAHDLADEAIEHGVASGEREWTEGLVADESLRRLNAGQIATVRGWLDSLGQERVREAAQLSLSYAWCQALTGDLEGAEARVADAVRAAAAGRLGGPLSSPMVPVEIALLGSYLAEHRGDAPTAVAEARRALALIPDGLPPTAESTLRGDAGVFLARALLRAGELERGVETYEAAMPDLRAGRNLLAVSRGVNDLATIAIASGDPRAALRLCEEEVGRTPGVEGCGPLWEARSKAHEALGETEDADGAARTALDLAIRQGDGQVAAWATDAIARAIARPAREGRTPERGATGQDGLVEPLTPRELEVLALVALGRSNSRIAAELFVSVGTVKSHVHAICGKLGAANRVEAAARAREVGLLH